jgi:predicted nucleotidyltransferase
VGADSHAGEMVDRLLPLLEARSDVDAAWLCGSRATGRARTDSDLDVAVLFTRAVASDAGSATFRRGRLSDELSGALHLPVDVLDVERLSPTVFASVMAGAVLLMDREPGRRVEALARQYALWHDTEPLRALRRQALEARFGSGRRTPAHRSEI